MPFFKSKQYPIVYSSSSWAHRNTTLTNAQADDVYWIQTPSIPQDGPTFIYKPSPSLIEGPMICVAEINRETAQITYEGITRSQYVAFPRDSHLYWARIIPTPFGNYKWTDKLKLLDPNGREVGRWNPNPYFFKTVRGPAIQLSAEVSNLNMDMIILSYLVMRNELEKRDEWREEARLEVEQQQRAEEESWMQPS